MTESISLTIPLTHSALTRTSDMLYELATDLLNQNGVTPPEAEFTKKEAIAIIADQNANPLCEAEDPVPAAQTEAEDPVPAAQTEAEDPVPAVPTEAEDAFAPKPHYAGSMFDDSAPVMEPVVTPAIASTAPLVPANVNLDKNGLPWDERIHAGTKSKKADGNWKNKRGIDPAIVARVEAELRAAMSVPTLATPVQGFTNEVVSTFEQLAKVHDWTFAYSDDGLAFSRGDSQRKQLNKHFDLLIEKVGIVKAVEIWNLYAPDVCKKPTPTVEPTPVPNVQNPIPNVTTPMETVTPVLPVTVPGITTLPQLMAAATGAGKTPQDMQAAAAVAGLASVALLGARPDLIPTVAASLGLGG